MYDDRARVKRRAVGAGHRRPEFAVLLAEVEQLLQLQADPVGVDHPHVQRQQLAQPVEHLRILAGQPKRIRAGGCRRAGSIPSRPARNRRRCSGCCTSTVQLIVPSVPALGSLRENSASSTGVGAWSISRNVPSSSQRWCTMRAKAATTPLTQTGSPSGGNGIWKPCSSRDLASASSFMLQPGAVFRAHVHRQRLGDGAQPARLLGAVDPDLERHGRRARLRR